MQDSETDKRIQTKHELEKYDLILEFMLNAMRLKDGVSLELLEKQTRINIKTIKNKLQIAKDMGLLKVNDTRIKPTEHGYNFLDDLINIFANEE
jgi:oxygen-independent coproporphyrinogen-3 oxidase